MPDRRRALSGATFVRGGGVFFMRGLSSAMVWVLVLGFVERVTSVAA
jgi:hypothetical protein